MEIDPGYLHDEKKNLHDESDVTHGCGDAALGEFKQ